MEISKLKDLLGDIPETETKKLNVYVQFEKRVSEFSYQITDDSGAVFTLDLTNSRQKSDSFEGKWGKCLSVMKHGDKCLQANSNSYILEDKQKTEDVIWNTSNLIKIKPKSIVDTKIPLKVLQKYETKTVNTRFGESKLAKILVGDRVSSKYLNI